MDGCSYIRYILEVVVPLIRLCGSPKPFDIEALTERVRACIDAQ